VRIAEDGAFPLARFHKIELFGGDGALHEVCEFPPGHLGTVHGVQKPPAKIIAFKSVKSQTAGLPRGHDSSNTDVAADDAVSEKKPRRDKSIIA